MKLFSETLDPSERNYRKRLDVFEEAEFLENLRNEKGFRFATEMARYLNVSARTIQRMFLVCSISNRIKQEYLSFTKETVEGWGYAPFSREQIYQLAGAPEEDRESLWLAMKNRMLERRVFCQRKEQQNLIHPSRRIAKCPSEGTQFNEAVLRLQKPEEVVRLIQSGHISFTVLKKLWVTRTINRGQLKDVFNILFADTRGLVVPVGRMLGIQTGTPEMEQFVQWIASLRHKGLLNRRSCFLVSGDQSEKQSEASEFQSVETIDGNTLAQRIRLGELSLAQLSDLWKRKEISRLELQRAFDILFTESGGRVKPLARFFKIKYGSIEMRNFVQWVAQKRGRGILSPRSKFRSLETTERIGKSTSWRWPKTGYLTRSTIADITQELNRMVNRK